MFIIIVTIDVAAAASGGNSRYGYNAAAALTAAAHRESSGKIFIKNVRKLKKVIAIVLVRPVVYENSFRHKNIRVIFFSGQPDFFNYLKFRLKITLRLHW